MDALSVKNLTKKYKDFTLSNISFDLPKGYILGYVGQNGAGKTTTISAITHLIKSKSDCVTINGISYKDNPKAYKESIGFIADETYFPVDLTPKDIAKIMGDFYSTFDKEKFNGYLDKWKLTKDKKVKDFSRGMKVKLMFASVLARETKLLILDEATNGLDPVIKDEILTILQEYISDGEHSVFFSTHILSDLEQIADYIFFIDKGQEILFESKDELEEKYMLVKGGMEDLTGEIERKIIGIKKTEVGFEGLVESNDAIFIGKSCVLEKPSIEQIVVRLIREKGTEYNGKF